MLNPDPHLPRAIATFVADEAGVTALEYGLLAALIAVACVGAFNSTGGSLEKVYVRWSGAVIAAL